MSYDSLNSRAVQNSFFFLPLLLLCEFCVLCALCVNSFNSF
jgi:hypothetical protein